MARNCDQIATMRRGTGRDGCPTPTGGMAVELGRQGRGGTERMGGDGRAMATDLAVGGSNPSRHATKPQVRGLGRLLCLPHGDRDQRCRRYDRADLDFAEAPRCSRSPAQEQPKAIIVVPTWLPPIFPLPRRRTIQATVGADRSWTVVVKVLGYRAIRTPPSWNGSANRPASTALPSLAARPPFHHALTQRNQQRRPSQVGRKGIGTVVSVA